jgi:two-component system response regulator GlrR
LYSRPRWNVVRSRQEALGPESSCAHARGWLGTTDLLNFDAAFTPSMRRLEHGMERQPGLLAGIHNRGGGPASSPWRMIGESPVFQRAIAQIQKMAASDAPVLVEGETGTGKELAVRCVHYLGARRQKPFIPINCGAIPDELVEAELFGYERGAFTDAKTPHPGVVAQADGGTLFLDEIDALSAKAQVTLLRFLQDQRYRALGSPVERSVDVRIMAAANCDLHDAATKGTFRTDLLYRLDILSLRLPALRDRPGDVVLLAMHFVQQFCRKYNTGPRTIDDDALALIQRYAWPGNVRELENAIHRAFLLADGECLHASLFDRQRAESASGPDASGTEGSDTEGSDAPIGDFRTAKARILAQFERGYLTRVLAAARGNVTLAARLANKERRAFGKMLKKYGINSQHFRIDTP